MILSVNLRVSVQKPPDFGTLQNLCFAIEESKSYSTALRGFSERHKGQHIRPLPSRFPELLRPVTILSEPIQYRESVARPYALRMLGMIALSPFDETVGPTVVAVASVQMLPLDDRLH